MKISPSPDFMKRFMKNSAPPNTKSFNVKSPNVSQPSMSSGSGKKSRLVEALKKKKKF